LQANRKAGLLWVPPIHQPWIWWVRPANPTRPCSPTPNADPARLGRGVARPLCGLPRRAQPAYTRSPVPEREAARSRFCRRVPGYDHRARAPASIAGHAPSHAARTATRSLAPALRVPVVNSAGRAGLVLAQRANMAFEKLSPALTTVEHERPQASMISAAEAASGWADKYLRGGGPAAITSRRKLTFAPDASP
jgi:hypothetical protein